MPWVGLSGFPGLVDRAFGVLVEVDSVVVTSGFPPPTGDLKGRLRFQSLKIRMAKKRHMPPGYAAVGAVLKPPALFLPIVL